MPFPQGIRNDRFCRSSDLLRIYRLPTIRILAVAQVIGKSCNRRSQQRDCLGVTPNFHGVYRKAYSNKTGSKDKKDLCLICNVVQYFINLCIYSNRVNLIEN